MFLISAIDDATIYLFYCHQVGPGLAEETRANLAAAFQTRAINHLVDRTERAITHVATSAGTHPPPSAASQLVVCGGVACNAALKAAINGMCARNGLSMVQVPNDYNRDNGTMIAWAGGVPCVAWLPALLCPRL